MGLLELIGIRKKPKATPYPYQGPLTYLKSYIDDVLLKTEKQPETNIESTVFYSGDNNHKIRFLVGIRTTLEQTRDKIRNYRTTKDLRAKMRDLERCCSRAIKDLQRNHFTISAQEFIATLQNKGKIIIQEIKKLPWN